LDERPIIALLPGSRKQEIERMLSVMLSVTPDFPDYQFVVAGAPSQEEAYYEKLFRQFGALTGVRLISGATYPLLREARAALVTSGTATLETALLGVPQIVCYRGNPVSYAIAKQLINVKYISLVNLIMDQELVLELIQGDLNPNRLRQELQNLLTPKEQARIQSGYRKLRQRLGQGGAPQRCAQLLVDDLKHQLTQQNTP
ncbi:MAG: lipid-A-disaccharide synthase, partial [Bacteroidetes bacterium]